MLGTRDRTLLLDSLRPPAGYRLRRAIGTTFNLDLMALLSAPLAFTFFDAHDQEGAPVADPVALIEALRRHADQVTIFCQAGAIGVPRPDQRLLAFLEDSVIEVQPRQRGGVFHPKIWFIQYESKQENAQAVYRILCLSRNLTFARSWDTCLRLEGELTSRRRGYWRNKPFADLLLALPDLAIRPITHALQREIERMAYEIRRVNFRLPPNFTDFRVHNFGLWRRRGRPFPMGGRSLVVSPYLVGSVVRDLEQDHGLEVLISRPEALDGIAHGEGRQVLPEHCYILSPGADLNARDSDEEAGRDGRGPPAGQQENELVGLHAKLFLFEKGGDARLFTGSANATSAAFGRNVEVLIEMIGSKRHCGIEALLGRADDATQDDVRSILQEWSLADHIAPPDENRELLERKADRLARRIASVRHTATVHSQDGGGSWDMTICASISDYPAGAEIKIWPATLSPDASVRIAVPDGASVPGNQKCSPIAPIATFGGISFEALTAFLSFEIGLRDGPHEVRRRFVATAELVGAPANRKQRLLRSLLKDRHRVMQLLLLILMGEGADVSAFAQAAGQGHDSDRASFAGWGRAALLESLLRCLSSNPERIDEVAALIADLGRTAGGEDLIPEGLHEIWEPVWAAREALGS